MKSIEILVIVVLGGMGSMSASIVSATVLTVLPELLRSVADYRMVAYSLALVIMMIFRPKGLFGSYDFSMSRVLEKRTQLCVQTRTEKPEGGRTSRTERPKTKLCSGPCNKYHSERDIALPRFSEAALRH